MTGLFQPARPDAEPGYIDGHHGEWLAAGRIGRHIRAYWLRAIRFMCMSPAILVWANAGYSAKNAGRETTFITALPSSTLASARRSRFGELRPWEQVSANVYYLQSFRQLAKSGIGYERASQMARIGSCFAAGINTPCIPISPWLRRPLTVYGWW